MAFAQPLALALFTLFIPVLLLYLLKQRRRHIRVSTLLFWDKILRDEHSVTSMTRLRKLLSLLLQLLIITMLVLALARPIFSKDLLGTRRIVLLLDTSASMTSQEAEGTRFELARAKVENEIRAMSLGDSAMLVAVGVKPDVVSPFTDSRKNLLDVLSKVTVTHGPAQWDAAFELVRNLAPDPRETHVYVISDGAFDPVAFIPPERSKFAFLPLGKTKDNIGITAFQVRALPGAPRDFEIFFEITNASEKERRIPYEVRVAEQLVDAGEATLGPETNEVRSVRQFSSEGGSVEVILDSPDAFPIDNHAYGVLPKVERVRVLLVTDNNLFLESALGTDDGIELQTIAPAAYPGLPAAQPDVTIFDRWAPPATPSGPAIFIAAWPADFGLQSSGELTDAIITDWEKEHMLNQHVGLKNITIPKGLKVVPSDGFQVLVRSFENPLIVARKSPTGQALAFTFDTTETDLPLRVAYPILVANSIRYLAGIKSDSNWQSPPIGQILTASELTALQQRQGHYASESIRQIVAPANPTQPQPFTADTLLPVMQAGIYYGETTTHDRFPLFAANVNSRRETHIAPATALPVLSDRPLPEIEPGLRLGTEPWLALTVLAFITVCTEWWLFHRRIVE